jgi:hypothetical protein
MILIKEGNDHCQPNFRLGKLIVLNKKYKTFYNVLEEQLDLKE